MKNYVFNSLVISIAFGVFWLSTTTLIALKALAYSYILFATIYDFTRLTLSMISFFALVSFIFMQLLNVYHRISRKMEQEEEV